jgi:hypothetical protein
MLPVAGEQDRLTRPRRAARVRDADHEVACTKKCTLVARQLHGGARFGSDTGPSPEDMRQADCGKQAVARTAHENARSLLNARILHGARNPIGDYAPQRRKIDRACDGQCNVGSESLSGFEWVHGDFCCCRVEMADRSRAGVALYGAFGTRQQT